MSSASPTTADQVKAYCASIGEDRLLVQAAGGNVSWKEGDVLWVKASGTWLADAARHETFVPVDLPGLRRAAAGGDFAHVPAVLGASKLRPSIEVMLHALMPAPVVVHLHPVEILAHMVRPDAEEILRRRLDASLRWTYVGYSKPGAELASAVAARLHSGGPAQAVFLGSHGIVVAGVDVAEVAALLDLLIERLRNPLHPYASAAAQPHDVPRGYAFRADDELNQLAACRELFHRLQANWALYPDHVVFLGPQPCFVDPQVPGPARDPGSPPPPYLFARGVGVFESAAATRAQRSQLGCYLDVLLRTTPDEPLVNLTPRQIADLLGWESEQYRQSLSSGPAGATSNP